MAKLTQVVDLIRSTGGSALHVLGRNQKTHAHKGDLAHRELAHLAAVSDFCVSATKR